MILKIEKAILHIVGIANESYSDNELDISDAHINSYIVSQLEKMYAGTSLQRGKFFERSQLLHRINKYRDNSISFTELSQFIGERIHEIMTQMDKPPENVDIIFCQFVTNDETVLALLKFENKKGNVHRTFFEGGKVYNAIADTQIMPQTVSECAFIHEDNTIHYIGKLYKVDGERINLMQEDILDCCCEAVSSRESDTEIKKQIKNISANPLDSTVRMKKFITENIAKSVEATSEYSLNDLADKIFTSPSEKNEFIKNNIDAGIITEDRDKLIIDDYVIKKTNEKIRLVSDTGIEIKFPADFYNDESRLVIDNAVDGTITITLRNIGELQLK